MSSLNTPSALPANHLVVGVNETTARYESYDAARSFFARPHYIHLVLPLISDDDAQFGTQLEQKLYPFGTARNNKFHFRLLSWQGLIWNIMSIPRKDEPVVNSNCECHGRYLDRGMYNAFSKVKTEVFPFQGDSFRIVRMAQGLLATYQ